jgi:anti-sigma factor RsiW
MACEEWKEKLALHAGGDLAPEERAGVEEHLAQCAGCRAEFQKLEAAVSFASGFAPRVPAADEFLAGVRAKRARLLRRLVLKYSAAAAVVVAALAVGVLLVLWSGTGVPEGEVAAAPVEVERVGYSEAVVSVTPVSDKPMTIVWIVSEEVVSQSN